MEVVVVAERSPTMDGVVRSLTLQAHPVVAPVGIVRTPADEGVAPMVTVKANVDRPVMVGVPVENPLEYVGAVSMMPLRVTPKEMAAPDPKVVVPLNCGEAVGANVEVVEGNV